MVPGIGVDRIYDGVDAAMRAPGLASVPVAVHPVAMIPITRTSFDATETQLIGEVLASGWVAQGPMTERFELLFAAEVGCRHAIAVTSCTTGLHLLMVAMGVRPGDEVLVPAFTWVATANAVEQTGGTPVFVDVDPVSGNLDPRRLAAAVTSRTVGILPVHLFGLCADMTAVGEIARAHGLWVVEDAACALGATHAGRAAGRLGAAACFSFHPRKSITTGEGGMITTDSAELAALCRSLRNHGADPTSATGPMPEFPRLGFNYRLTDLQAALGVAQMGKLPRFLAERRRGAATYDRLLGAQPWLSIPRPPHGSLHAYQSYVGLLHGTEDGGAARDRVIAALAVDGIATRPGTHAPVLLAYYREKYRLAADVFPGACAAAYHSLALPLYPGISDAEIARVVDRLAVHHQQASAHP